MVPAPERFDSAGEGQVIGGKTAMHIRKPEKVDVVIIGAGATGGTSAKVFSEAGLKVVGLDRGPWLKREDFSGDEIKYVNRNFLVPDARLNPRTYRESE